jgi:hypothetical protein
MKIYLNLLPQERKNEMARKKRFGMIVRDEILFLLPLLVFILILADTYYVMNLQRNSAAVEFTLQQSQGQYQELSMFDRKFREANGTVASLLKFQTGHLHWMRFLENLSGAAPDGISISDLSSKNFQIFLIGKAKTRDNLLKFKENIQNSDCFHDVNVPLSDLVVKENADFQIDFYVSEDCLKQQS